MSLSLRTYLFQREIRSAQPISQHIGTMINVLQIPKHIIQPSTTHVDIVAPSKEIQTMNQMLTDSSPIKVWVIAEFSVVLHLLCGSLIIEIDKRLAIIEMRKLMREVMRAFFVQPAASKRIVGAAEGFGFLR